MGVFIDYGPLEDTSSRLAIPSLIFAILTPLFVTARCLCRKYRSGNFWLDDYLLAAATFLDFVGTVLMIVASEWALGKHEHGLLAHPPEKIPFGDGGVLIRKTLQVFYVDQIIYQVVMGLSKTAVLFWYTRIFETPNKKKFRWICWGLAAFVTLFTILSAFFTAFQCKPIASAWLISATEPALWCLNRKMYWDARAWLNIATYFLVTVLPMPSIFGIPGFVDGMMIMSKGKKISLCALFGVGIFVCIAAILRMQAIGLATLQKDRTWHAVDLCMWSIIEDNVGIICACLPAIARPTTDLLRDIAGYRRASSRTSSIAHLLQSGRHEERKQGDVSMSTTAASHTSEMREV